MIAVRAHEMAHVSSVTTQRTLSDRHGGRSYWSHSRAGVPAGRSSLLVTGERDSSAPPFVKGGRGDFPCVTELSRDQAPLLFEFSLSDSEILCACFRMNRSENTKGRRHKAKLAAVSALMSSFLAMEGGFSETTEIVPNIQIVWDSLGKPLLLIDGSEGPAVSFAYERDTMWVAIGPEGSSVGIDAADSTSFTGSYPFHRVFHEGELELGGERKEIAALMWSAKEAVVKALGCGFHLVDPLHVYVESCYGCQEGLLLKARLADKARKRLGVQSEIPITVRSLLHEGMWVSVASLD
jgi:phosphopantetheinyl transferase